MDNPLVHLSKPLTERGTPGTHGACQSRVGDMYVMTRQAKVAENTTWDGEIFTVHSHVTSGWVPQALTMAMLTGESVSIKLQM